MKQIDKTFEDLIIKEIDDVFKTYYRWIHKQDGKFSRPKCMHVYWWVEFKNKVAKTLDSNPLMNIICKTIGVIELYYPIYSRSWTWYRKSRWTQMNKTWDFYVPVFYNKEERVWEYFNNQIDPLKDRLIWWYPLELTWLFIERPISEKKWDLLIYYIKKRYDTSKKKYDENPVINWGTNQ